MLGRPGFAHTAVTAHIPPWAIIEVEVTDSKDGPHRHIDLIYVCQQIGGVLSPQLEEVSGARWVPLADVAALATPPELPELVAAAAKWVEKPANPVACTAKARSA